jgi:uroporphyrinogen decarboxylase
MKEIAAACRFNILHVCDYVAPYSGYDAVRDYPGHIVNCNTRLTNREMSPVEIAQFFKRPYMGGLDRHGILVKGTPAQVEAEIKRVVKAAPPQFILGADCTVEADTSWDRLRHAIGVAHRTGR